MRTIVTLVLAALAAGAIAQDGAKPDQAAPYPLDRCIVSGDEFGGDMGEPVVTVYKGREIKFCCKDCVKDFEKNPEKFVKKIDEEAAKKKDAGKQDGKQAK
jgi:YHS domain-containing protein